MGKAPCWWTEPTLPNHFGLTCPRKVWGISLPVFINRRNRQSPFKSFCPALGNQPDALSDPLGCERFPSLRQPQLPWGGVLQPQAVTPSGCVSLCYRLQSWPSQGWLKMTRAWRLPLFTVPPTLSPAPPQHRHILHGNPQQAKHMTQLLQACGGSLHLQNIFKTPLDRQGGV